MSEYWVSHKKYFCKYCEIYIADDVPSRRQHESGLRHIGNRDRYVRGLYKQGERKKKDLEEEKREMARVEQAANAAFARDVSFGHASVASSSQSIQPSASTSTSKKPEKPTSKWDNYSTAQSLGYTDPDEERRRAELERRQTQGLVGEWETVAPSPPLSFGGVQDVTEEADTEATGTQLTLPQKREADGRPDDDSDGRNFKLRRRTLGVGLGEIWDPGDIPIKLKSRVKKEELPSAEQDDGAAGITSITNREDVRATSSDEIDIAGPEPVVEKPKWKPMGWKRATLPENDNRLLEKKEPDKLENVARNNNPSAQMPQILQSTGFVKTEPRLESDRSLLDQGSSLDIPSDNLQAARDEIKEEEETNLAPIEQIGSLFKKRKIPSGNRGRR